MEQRADGRYSEWRVINSSSSKLIDGGDPNGTTFTLLNHDRESGAALKAQLAYVRIMNRSGGNANLGFGVRLTKTSWKAGQWTHGSTTFTDDTTDFQSTATTDAPLETLVNGDGFLVQASTQFNAFSILGATASNGGSPVRVLEYSTASGVWTSLTVVTSFAAASANYSTGENLIWWTTPVDWAPMSGSHGTGVTAGLYGLRVRATTAPTITAGVATSISVHRIYFPRLNVPTLTDHIITIGGLYAPLDLQGDALVVASSVSGAQHAVDALVRIRG